MKARFDGICARCHEDFFKGQQIVPHRSGYMHLGCASGQDER